MKLKAIFFVVIIIFLASFVVGQQLTTERMNKVTYGKVIYIKNVSIDPKVVFPGSDVYVKIEMENIGDSELKDIIVRLDLPSQFSPAIGDVVEKKLRSMQGRERENLIFSVSALPDSTAGIYSFPLNIKYTNEIGDVIEENNTISLAIGAEPEMLVKIADSTIYKGNNVGTVTISFINRGMIDLKFLTVEMKPSNYFFLLSSNKAYMGDIDSDDFEETDFKIKVINESEKIMLPLKLIYRDANNKEFNEEIELELFIPEKEDVNKSSNVGYWVIGICIILVAVYLAFRLIKKRE